MCKILLKNNVTINKKCTCIVKIHPKFNIFGIVTFTQYTLKVKIREDSTMQFEENRLNSFKNPNWKCNIMDINRLAKYGFYYFGVEDHVRCYFCEIEIGEWEPNDDADKTHHMWSPECTLLCGLDVRNVPIDSSDRSCSQETSVFLDLDQTRLADNLHIEPIFNSFSLYDSRIKSFENWPVTIIQRPEKLAEAGFFYTGSGGHTLCFCCGGELDAWGERKNPWEEHAKWFPHCKFVLMNKGENFVRRACSKESSVNSAGTSHQQTFNEFVTESLSNMPNVNKSSIEDVANKIVEEYRICKICFTEPMNTVFLPCGHVVACARCTRLLNNCAVCRKKIQSSARAFFS